MHAGASCICMYMWVVGSGLATVDIYYGKQLLQDRAESCDHEGAWPEIWASCTSSAVHVLGHIIIISKHFFQGYYV